jgi:peptide/nickel transport system ATP-binding protein
VSVQARVLELFGELQERFGFATLFITHDLAVVDMLARTASSCCTRAHRRDRADRAVLGDPQDDYTRKLIASLPVPDPGAGRAPRGLARARG